MFHFNTNKPQSFFFFFFFSCRIPVVLESHRSSRSYSPNISHMKDCTALKLGHAFCIFTFFHFPVSGLYVLHDLLWFLFLNAWLSENQRQNAACALWLRKARVYEVEAVYNFQGRVEIIGSQTGATPQCHLLPYLLPQTIQKPNHPFTSKSSFPVL